MMIGGILFGFLGDVLGALQMAGFTFNQFFIVFAMPFFLGAILVIFSKVNVRRESVERFTEKLPATT